MDYSSGTGLLLKPKKTVFSPREGSWVLPIVVHVSLLLLWVRFGRLDLDMSGLVELLRWARAYLLLKQLLQTFRIRKSEMQTRYGIRRTVE